jgi:uncharacterized protein YraI
VIPAGAHIEYHPFVGRTNGYVSVSYQGIDGWSYAAYLWLFPSNATTTDYLNFRSGPSLDAPVLAVMPPGSNVQVLNGPSDGFYNIRYNDDPGWAFGGYLDFGGGSDKFAEDDEVVVDTDALNLRAGPGLGDDVSWVLLQGRALVVTGGPINADGYLWYEVDAGSAGTGWVAGAYLAAA